MIKLILGLLMVCSIGFADSPKGYLWYNLAKEIPKKPAKKGISFKKKETPSKFRYAANDSFCPIISTEKNLRNSDFG